MQETEMNAVYTHALSRRKNVWRRDAQGTEVETYIAYDDTSVTAVQRSIQRF